MSKRGPGAPPPSQGAVRAPFSRYGAAACMGRGWGRTIELG